MIDCAVVNILYNNSLCFLDPNGINLDVGDLVVCETDLGSFVGKVIKETYKEKTINTDSILKKVIRKANEKDLENDKNNNIESAKIKEFSRKTAINLGLEMSFVDARYNLDRTILVIIFTSDNRVDFRELAKKLAQKYKSRIELRQIGVRDKSKIIGGIGPCGLKLCCNTFLTDFNSVSINMAKNQNLSLAPNKINGTCGRLLCCLSYENQTYSQIKSKLPKIGTEIETVNGVGKVVSVDVVNESYTVEINNKGTYVFKKDEI